MASRLRVDQCIKIWRSKNFRLNPLIITLLIIFVAGGIASGTVAHAASSFTIMEAGEREVVTTGGAQGTLSTTFDRAAQTDVLSFNYSAPQGATVGLSVKDFPPELTADQVNTVRIGIRVVNTEQVRRISANIELKGTKGTQSIPLKLTRRRNSFKESIDWPTLGSLNEVALIFSPIAGEAAVKGAMVVVVDFVKRAPPKEESVPVTTPAPRETPAAVEPPGETPPEVPVRAVPTSFNLLDARQREIISAGTAKGTILPTFDEVVDKDVLEFDYSVDQGATIGVSLREFPAELGSRTVNTVRAGLRVPKSEQVHQIAVSLEIKGRKDTQSIPLSFTSGWNSVHQAIDWDLIGELTEVVFLVSPLGQAESVDGTVNLALTFVKRVPSEPTPIPAQTFECPYNLLDARRKGVFNIGPAQGTTRVIFDEGLQKDIVRFDYTAPIGTHIGIWTQEFPPEVNKDTVDAVRIGVKVPHPDQVNEVSVKIEIKSASSWQTIPVSLKPGWNYVHELVNWSMIGDLKEVVFVVSPISTTPMGGGFLGSSAVEVTQTEDSEALTGTLYFDFGFGELTFFQKYFIVIKIGLIILFSVLVALLSAHLARLVGRNRPSSGDDAPTIRDSASAPLLARLKRDFLYGIVAVVIAAVALWIYALGEEGVLDAGFNFSFLAIGLLGAVIAAVLKMMRTGKHLTPLEVFQNILLTGILAAASSRQELWQAPATWVQLVMISNLTAALTFLVYHIANAAALATRGKHIRILTGILIVGTPFLFGWLLLLQNVNLLTALASSVTVGMLAAWPFILEQIGRVLVIFLFNEAFANGISMATKRRTLKTLKSHLYILLVSIGVVVAPLIADAGSTEAVGALPAVIRIIIALITTMLSFAGLWGEVYLITGIALDGGHHTAPSEQTIHEHVKTGMKKGIFYSGYLLALLFVIHLLLSTQLLQTIMKAVPILTGILVGALVFPLLKTIIETFDGSLPFLSRIRFSYRDKTLYARGAIAGYGFAYMITQGMFEQAMPERITFGLVIGLIASAGVSILRDALYGFKGQGRIQSWRLYITDALMGIFVGSAAAFYLDARQVPVVVEKFKLYTSAGFSAVNYVTYPLVNKWGRIDLGTYSGGAKLLFSESLAGVINWAIAAWLFAINKVFLQAFFEKHAAPIKFFFSRAGFAQLIEHMIYVLRWGLWMSPIIFTFLRMMPDPTWYNQDGAIRTLFSIYQNATLSPEAFRNWSLTVFVYILAFDFLRVLIWMDHMGLRVATLVNLSFIGLDRLDERVAKFIGPATAQRYIPEAVKRFCTWGPLLIPFYLPRGNDWDYAWSTSEAMQSANGGGGIIATLQSLSIPQLMLLIVVAILIFMGMSFCLRSRYRRLRQRRIKAFEVRNREYRVVVKANGEVYSDVEHQKRGVFPPEHDISRRSYDIIDPCGRVLYVVDTAQWQKSPKRFWPVIGNFPYDRFSPSQISRANDSLTVVNTVNGIKTTIDIRVPDLDTTAELWTVSLENLTNESRELKVVPYLEWVLNGGLHDRFHTQYARLFPEMEYVSEANAILAWQKSTKAMGFLAVDKAPEGFLTSRMDFIGRARSIWEPRILQTLNFDEACDTAPYPTFDPIGSLMVKATVQPKASRTIRLMIGYATKRKAALEMIQEHLKPQAVPKAARSDAEKKLPLIGHGEIPPGTPQPYSEYIDNGNKLLVRTPYTTRPYDHALSNALHSVMVTNRGLHTSCNGNSQQNRLTPDWPDTVTKEIPAEAIYLYDPDHDEWYSPTHHPLNEYSAKNESEFGVDGTAVFRMTHGTVSTELTVFVPPEDPTGIYLLTVRNNGDDARTMRIAPYFQMVLEFQPERSGSLQKRYNKALNALFMSNPRNMFRTGWAFAAMTTPAERVETKRGRFFGRGRGIRHPYMVEKGEPDKKQFTDDRQIAAFLGTMRIPARGEATVAVILGQTDTWKQAVEVVKKYTTVEAARQSLEATRTWWLSLMKTVEVKTNTAEFDRILNWLKYQALAERIWPRRGFYQTSGAFGFRDQLQDTVNLLWVDPALARKQIILHASHQFFEGDVFHWFFTRTDGRTAFSCRSHASDNPLWLAWGVVEYIRATGDHSILDEMASYVISEFPFADLPKNKAGWGHLYHRATRADTVYRHCLRSIDLVFNKRTGKHGLPLIRTGDWNDGLDEIGSEGHGESVWLGFFLYYIMKDMLDIIGKKEGDQRKEQYAQKMEALKEALEATWREDRYLRAFHDDGTEIGVKDSGIWEIDALTVAWVVMCGINQEREEKVFHTALGILEKENAVLLGWPALREDSKPYLGRSSKYPEGVRENGMYCHGVQWMIKAARILTERAERRGDSAKAAEYRAIAYRLWRKITPVGHVTPEEIEIYGGQPNKQPADILTNFDRGRMIWNGYTGAAGWLFRQSIEGVVGASLSNNEMILPTDLDKPRGELVLSHVSRDLHKSPL